MKEKSPSPPKVIEEEDELRPIVAGLANVSGEMELVRLRKRKDFQNQREDSGKRPAVKKKKKKEQTKSKKKKEILRNPAEDDDPVPAPRYGRPSLAQAAKGWKSGTNSNQLRHDDRRESLPSTPSSSDPNPFSSTSSYLDEQSESSTRTQSSSHSGPSSSSRNSSNSSSSRSSEDGPVAKKRSLAESWRRLRNFEEVRRTTCQSLLTGAPGLINLVPHPDMHTLTSEVLNGNETSSTVVCGVDSQGGLGKTWFAVSCALNPRVRMVYPRQVFLTVGKCKIEPERFLRDKLAVILSRLDGNVQVPRRWDVRRILDELRLTLRRYRTLFILDDVWDSQLALLLASVARERGFLLITTRLDAVVQSFGGTVYQMAKVPLDFALLIFRAHASMTEGDWEHSSEKEKRVMEDIVLQCGGIPLALQMAGAYCANVRSSTSRSSDTLDLLERYLQQLSGKQVDPVNKLLSANSHHLSLRHRGLLILFGIFMRNLFLSIDTVRALYGLSELQARELHFELNALGFLEPQADLGFQFHNLTSEWQKRKLSLFVRRKSRVTLLRLNMTHDLPSKLDLSSVDVCRYLNEVHDVPLDRIHFRSGRTVLHHSYYGDEAFEYFLAQRSIRRMVDKTDQGDQTPLWIACRNGDRDVVVRLLDGGARVDFARSSDGASCLYMAAQNNHVDLVRLLLDRGASPNLVETDGTSPLYIASQKGSAKVVRLLLKAGAKPDAAKASGTTPLFIAAHHGFDDIVRMLVKEKVSVNRPRLKDGCTPLYIASQNGHTKVVRTLVTSHANPNLPLRSTGCTPLWIASQNGHREVVKILIAVGGKPNIERRADRVSILWIASRQGHSKIVRLLLAEGANVNLSDYRGTTPLWIACREGHLKVVRALLRAGADMHRNRKDDDCSPMKIASRHGHNEIVALLAKREARLLRPYARHAAAGAGLHQHA